MTTMQKERERERRKWDESHQRQIVEVLLDKLEETHGAAGHEVEHDGDSVSCEDCGLQFTGWISTDPEFGYIPTLSVSGGGRPQLVTATSELRAIALGTHGLYGLPEGPSDRVRAARLRAIGRTLISLLDEFERMTPFDNARADELYAEARLAADTFDELLLNAATAAERSTDESK